ncbi:NfeD-like C-terminal, partner-binding [Reichenbachiella agariperforans]|uniref:NfeD-like C-terminal, partner-binding n=1 Tax=Reichenbachiella agariperforans TaxID=156994 RepID=A0A1M6NI37_REIAG|nr:NfeD-like C-terminal, partner-binding [Reichenbachiella agariperforans]
MYVRYSCILGNQKKTFTLIDWIIICLLILTGIALIILEIIFVPGTTIVGIGGFLVGGYGIYHSYELFGAETGHWVLAVSVVAGFAAIIVSFKSNTWKRFALKGSIQSKVNENRNISLTVGLEGMTVSSLKPIGKGEFDGIVYEVRSLGNFIEQQKAIKIIKMEQNKIYVELI